MKDKNESFSKKMIEGVPPPEVSRPAPMPSSKSEGKKVVAFGDPEPTVWSPIAAGGSSGNEKIPMSDAPGPTKYPVSAASKMPSGGSGGVMSAMDNPSMRDMESEVDARLLGKDAIKKA